MGVLSGTISSNNGFGKFFFMLMALCIIGIGIYFISGLCEHAVSKHPEAVIVQDCLEKGQGLGTFIRRSDQHIALPCQVNSNLFGIKFDQCTGDNCTAFVKRKMKEAWKVIRYLYNSGYEPADQTALDWVSKNPPPSIFESW